MKGETKCEIIAFVFIYVPIRPPSIINMYGLQIQENSFYVHKYNIIFNFCIFNQITSYLIIKFMVHTKEKWGFRGVRSSHALFIHISFVHRGHEFFDIKC